MSAYETEPIGDGNPYRRCKSCKVSDPQISISGHRSHCEYLRENRAKVLIQKVRDITLGKCDASDHWERYEQIRNLLSEIEELVT